MATRHTPYLYSTQASGLGGQRLTAPEIVRGAPWAGVLWLGGDVSSDSFKGSLGTEPDNGDSKIADFAVSIGDSVDGETPVTFSLTAQQTQTIPDDNGDGLLWGLYEVWRRPVEGQFYRLATGPVPFHGRVGDV